MRRTLLCLFLCFLSHAGFSDADFTNEGRLIEYPNGTIVYVPGEPYNNTPPEYTSNGTVILDLGFGEGTSTSDSGANDGTDYGSDTSTTEDTGATYPQQATPTTDCRTSLGWSFGYNPGCRRFLRGSQPVDGETTSSTSA